MDSPPLHSVSDAQFYVSGDVTIHPNAAIAPGVLLQADPESQIIIADGVCIGMGAVLHAHQGTLEVGEGANIGSAVLIVGQGTVGTNACIGSMTTILNYSVRVGEVVPPGSLLGDTSRQASDASGSKSSTYQYPPSNNRSPETVNALSAESSNNSQALESKGASTQVYGQANLNRLLSTLLPHRQSLNQPLQEKPSSPDSS